MPAGPIAPGTLTLIPLGVGGGGGTGASFATYNVMDYGAIGGGGDDTLAITTAITTVPPGGTLVFPAGYTFGYSGVITFTHSMRVEAEGATFEPLANGSYMQLGGVPPVSDIRWYGGHIANPGGFTGTYGLILNIKERALVEGLTVTDVVAEGVVVVGDGREIYTCNTTATSATITDTAAGFTAADVGKQILVEGAGYGGQTLEGQITAYLTTSTVTINVTARTSVTAANCFIATHTKVVIRDLDVQNSGSNGLRFNPYVFGGLAENCSVKNNCAAGGAAFFSHLSPRVTFARCRAMNVTTNGIRIDGFANKVVQASVVKTAIHGIRLQGEQGEAQNCDVMQEPGYYTYVITPNAGAGSPAHGMTTARDCKIIGGTSVGGGGVLIQENTPVLGQVVAPVVKGLTIEGSSVAGLQIQSGNHAELDLIVRDCNSIGVYGANGNITGAGVFDVNLNIQAYSNGSYGVQTTGLCDRWRITGHSRAAENTAGATSLVGTNNVTGLIV